jgi:hypothetical protein
MSKLDTSIELIEFLDQLNYCLSLDFKEKWRHKYSTHFISIFQEKVLKALETQKPIKLSSLYSVYSKKYKYNTSVLIDFFEDISIEDYYPIIYEDSKFRKRK